MLCFNHAISRMLCAGASLLLNMLAAVTAQLLLMHPVAACSWLNWPDPATLPCQ